MANLGAIDKHSDSFFSDFWAILIAYGYFILEAPRISKRHCLGFLTYIYTRTRTIDTDNPKLTKDMLSLRLIKAGNLSERPSSQRNIYLLMRTVCAFQSLHNLWEKDTMVEADTD